MVILMKLTLGYGFASIPLQGNELVTLLSFIIYYCNDIQNLVEGWHELEGILSSLFLSDFSFPLIKAFLIQKKG